jgi:hypothetical protein
MLSLVLFMMYAVEPGMMKSLFVIFAGQYFAFYCGFNGALQARL